PTYIYTLSLHDALPISGLRIVYEFKIWVYADIKVKLRKIGKRICNLKNSLLLAFINTTFPLFPDGNVLIFRGDENGNIPLGRIPDRKSTRLNSSHVKIS